MGDNFQWLYEDAKDEAWVNWNPNPAVHAFGRILGQRHLAKCNVQVRRRVGDFDPDDANACPQCVRICAAQKAEATAQSDDFLAGSASADGDGS